MFQVYAFVIFAFASPGVAIALGAGSSHTCVILFSGAVVCCGENDSGQAGIGNMDVANLFSPTPVNLGGGV